MFRFVTSCKILFSQLFVCHFGFSKCRISWERDLDLSAILFLTIRQIYNNNFKIYVLRSFCDILHFCTLYRYLCKSPNKDFRERKICKAEIRMGCPKSSRECHIRRIIIGIKVSNLVFCRRKVATYRHLTWSWHM